VSLAIKKDWEKGGVSFQHNNFFVLFFLGKIYLEFFVLKFFSIWEISRQPIKIQRVVLTPSTLRL
jgi:hypothetical protein